MFGRQELDQTASYTVLIPSIFCGQIEARPKKPTGDNFAPSKHLGILVQKGPDLGAIRASGPAPWPSGNGGERRIAVNLRTRDEGWWPTTKTRDMADSRTATSTGRWRTVLDVAVQIAFIAAAGTLIYASIFRPAPSQFQSETPAARRSGSPIPSEPVSLESATLHGATGATVALIVFSDFECPYCARFARETLPTLYEKYVRPGKVRIAFRHYPLTIHPRAQKAAEAAECAGAQGKFWEMHDRLFENPKQLGTENLGQYARSLGLEPTRFERCLAGEMTAKIHEDANQARALGVSGTPAFLIGAVSVGRSRKGRAEAFRRPAFGRFRKCLGSAGGGPFGEAISLSFEEGAICSLRSTGHRQVAFIGSGFCYWLGSGGSTLGQCRRQYPP